MGADRHRTTVHRWIQKADIQPTDGGSPNHVAVDETVIQLNSERYWLYAAVDPDTNRLLHIRLYPTRTNAMSSMFLPEFREEHHVDDAVFLFDGAPWLQPVIGTDSDSNTSHIGIGMPSNVSFVK